jgi:hypothetical protein
MWNMKRMPNRNQLDVNCTFESQKEMVTKTIIPALFKVLDPERFPVGESVLYEMIHQNHRHKREEILRKKKNTTAQTKEITRQHANSRQNEVIY